MIKDTIAPIPIELLKEYFSDDSIIFNINYAESILKGEKLITYLSNLDVPCKLTGWDKVSSSDKLSFIKDYMNSKLIVKNYELELCVLKILYEASQLEFFVEYQNEDILTKEEILSFCKNEDNKDTIDKWLTMLASCSLYALTTVPDIAEMVKKEYEIIDDYDYCGVNFVQLFRHEVTQELLTSDREVYYFDKQFNETMFKGANMYSYWNNDANSMAIITWGISSGDITYNEFNSMIQKGLDNVSTI